MAVSSVISSRNTSASSKCELAARRRATTLRDNQAGGPPNRCLALEALQARRFGIRKPPFNQRHIRRQGRGNAPEQGVPLSPSACQRLQRPTAYLDALAQDEFGDQRVEQLHRQIPAFLRHAPPEGPPDVVEFRLDRATTASAS